MKAGAELDQRGDAAVDAYRARRGLADAGNQLQHRALARSVAADDAERLPGGDVEASRPSAPRTSRRAGGRPARCPRAARSSASRILPPAVAAVELVNVTDLDRVRPSHFFRERVAQPVEDEVADDETPASDAAPTTSSRRHPANGPGSEEHLLIGNRQVRERIQVQQPARATPAPATADR